MPCLKTTKHWSGIEHGQVNESAFNDLVFKRYDTVSRGFEGRGWWRSDVSCDELLARIPVAYTNAVAVVLTGIELARSDPDDDEVQGVLTGFGGGDDRMGPDERT